MKLKHLKQLWDGSKEVASVTSDVADFAKKASTATENLVKFIEILDARTRGEVHRLTLNDIVRIQDLAIEAADLANDSAKIAHAAADVAWDFKGVMSSAYQDLRDGFERD